MSCLLTDGEFDPWRAYCIGSIEDDDLGVPGRKFTTRVPKCGVSGCFTPELRIINGMEVGAMCWGAFIRVLVLVFLIYFY